MVTGLVLLPPRNAVLPAQTRTKGLPVQMSIFVKPGGPRASVRPHGAKPGERVAPGDALRFAVGAARAGHLSVWEEEGSGRLVQHFPIGGAPATRPWPAGPPRLLPGSLVLDESAGPSRFAAVLCEEPLEPEPLRNAVAQILSRIDAPVGSAPAETDSCVGMVFELKKASGGG
ncbi:MAG: hypothetical protein D6729_13885 [Deltaproteobacteria bacterium]|nr:MAG: hypothetical protein D6729_13885 [Deltaproteobacteria bacterium]